MNAEALKMYREWKSLDPLAAGADMHLSTMLARHCECARTKCTLCYAVKAAIDGRQPKRDPVDTGNGPIITARWSEEFGQYLFIEPVTFDDINKPAVCNGEAIGVVEVHGGSAMVNTSHESEVQAAVLIKSIENDLNETVQRASRKVYESSEARKAKRSTVEAAAKATGRVFADMDMEFMRLVGGEWVHQSSWDNTTGPPSFDESRRHPIHFIPVEPSPMAITFSPLATENLRDENGLPMSTLADRELPEACDRLESNRRMARRVAVAARNGRGDMFGGKS